MLHCRASWWIYSLWEKDEWGWTFSAETVIVFSLAHAWHTHAWHTHAWLALRGRTCSAYVRERLSENQTTGSQTKTCPSSFKVTRKNSRRPDKKIVHPIPVNCQFVNLKLCFQEFTFRRKRNKIPDSTQHYHFQFVRPVHTKTKTNNTCL